MILIEVSKVNNQEIKICFSTKGGQLLIMRRSVAA